MQQSNVGSYYSVLQSIQMIEALFVLPKRNSLMREEYASNHDFCVWVEEQHGNVIAMPSMHQLDA